MNVRGRVPRFCPRVAVTSKWGLILIAISVAQFPAALRGEEGNAVAQSPGNGPVQLAQEKVRPYEKRRRSHESKKRGLLNELLDLHVRRITIQFSDTNRTKLRNICFKIYQNHSKQLRLERRLYGTSGHRRDFYKFVQYKIRKRRKIVAQNKQCGFWFTEQIGKQPNALRYALADFAGHHNVNRQDKHSALMLGLIYETGRGIRRNGARAQYWFKRAKARGAKVDHLIRRR